MTSGTFNSISTTVIRVAAAQVNTTVGDIEGNSQVIEKWIKLAQLQQAELIAFPELTITGYPPEDLVLYDNFIEANKTALRHVATKVKDIVAVVGFVDSEDGKLFNSAAVLHQGKIVTIYRKIHLPNYGVFDERRYFTPGDECSVISSVSKKLFDSFSRAESCCSIEETSSSWSSSLSGSARMVRRESLTSKVTI